MCAQLNQARIGFIGAGSMAEAIMRGLLERGIADRSRVFATNRSDDARLAELGGKYGIVTAREQEQLDKLVREADVVVLGMKPKDAASALADLGRLLHPGQLLVSVIAGLTISTIEHILGAPYPIVRTMPNTSSTIGLGAAGISFSGSVSPEQRAIGIALFEAVGVVCPVDENKLDIVTGVSGSGPAYVYYMMEAMIAGGVAGGLTEEQAGQLAVQTVLGAAQMVKSTGESPKELRRKVTSPNGTTQAAIELMEAARMGETVTRAVLRAAERAKEMGDALAEQSIQPGKRV